jgi:coniferyl-aldehyde dehydrogenase
VSDGWWPRLRAVITPVTLELGGKSPAIIDPSANIAEAAERIVYGKLMNAGQTCIAPDYVLIAPNKVDEFITKANRAVARMFGTSPDNTDYTSIVSDKHYARLEALCRTPPRMAQRSFSPPKLTIRHGNQNGNFHRPSSAALRPT